MKNYLNRIEDENGNIIIKFVKMGMDIDNNTNHRIRGIVPTDDGKYLFIEITRGHRFKKSYFDNLTKNEYEERFPYEDYLFCESCFRVDIPLDYYENYSKEFNKFDRHAFYKINHSKEGIIEFLQKFNKNIKDIKLIDKNYIDEYCDELGFYRLYDDKLEHKYEPVKIIYKTDRDLILNMKYSCYNYDKSIYFENISRENFNNYNMENLYRQFGKQQIDNLFDNYYKELEGFKEKVNSKNEEEYRECLKEKNDDELTI